MLNLDPWTVLWTGINLVVLYLLMRHFLFKPVTAMMEQRTKAIEDGLSQAEAAKQAAAALDQENEARLAQVRGQADQIVAQAKLQGQREYDQIISAAQADAQAIRTDAQAQMEAERRQMLQDAQQQVAALALLAVCAWLGNIGKNNKMFYIPMIFMLIVTLTSLAQTISTQVGKITAGAATDWAPYAQAILGVLLFILAIVLAVEGCMTIFGKKKNTAAK